MSTKQINIYAPCDGELIATNAIDDPVFAENMMGKTIGFIPEAQEIYNITEKGNLTNIFPTKHAYTINVDNVSILFHLGINTVSLKGEGFEVSAKENIVLDKNTHLVNVDWKTVLKKEGVLKTSAIIFIEDNLPSNAVLHIEKPQKVKKGQLIAKLTY